MPPKKNGKPKPKFLVKENLKIMKNLFYYVIVAGGRDFNNYALLKEKLDNLLSNKQHVVIISGCAKGADTLGERYGRENNRVVAFFPALWNQNGNMAGFIRNEKMAEIADACVCFWNGKSTGTKHMIETAKAKNLALRIIKY